MRVKWKNPKETLNVAELLSALAIYYEFKKAGNQWQYINPKRLPWVIMRDIRNTTPSSVVSGVNQLFQKGLEILQEVWSENNEEMMKEIESGKFDPTQEFIEDPLMINALGEVLMRHLRAKRGIKGTQAYDEARRLMSDAKEELQKFINWCIQRATIEYIQAIKFRGLRQIDINALKVRVLSIDEYGPVVQIEVDEEIVYLNDKWEDKPKKDSGVDPMYG